MVHNKIHCGWSLHMSSDGLFLSNYVVFWPVANTVFFVWMCVVIERCLWLLSFWVSRWVQREIVAMWVSILLTLQHYCYFRIDPPIPTSKLVSFWEVLYKISSINSTSDNVDYHKNEFWCVPPLLHGSGIESGQSVNVKIPTVSVI